MTMQKIYRVREFVLCGACFLSIWGAYPTIAGQPDTTDYDRLEKRVDRLTEASGTGALELEKRLSAIEWQQKVINEKMSDVTKLGLGIMASVMGLMIQALWGLIVRRHRGGTSD